MVHTDKRSRDSKPIAVIRSYHPIRIERELLAQVFDLAERGQSVGSRGAEGQSLAMDQIDSPRTIPSKQRSSIAPQDASQQRDELEAVA